jgi:ATP-dependent protease ClpP protease subunit
MHEVDPMPAKNLSIALTMTFLTSLASSLAVAGTVRFRGPSDQSLNYVNNASVASLISAVQKLKAAGDTEIKVVLNSDGGDLQAAYSGYLQLKDLGVDTYTEDTCASSCTILYAAGKHRTASGSAQFMFHPVHVELAPGLSGKQREIFQAKLKSYVIEFSQKWLEVVRSVDNYLAQELERDHTLTTGSDRYIGASTLRRSGYVSE